MKILKIAGLVVLVLVTIYILLLIALPSRVFVERSILVDAGEKEVYDYLEDLGNFQEWSYWAEIDPLTKYEYEGPSTGVGSRMNWYSDHIGMGFGSLWIISSTPNSQIELNIQLREFAKPARMHFNLLKEGDATRVIWDFQTEFFGYWKFFVPMMDGELGPAYEKGLLKIKRVLEKRREEE